MKTYKQVTVGFAAVAAMVGSAQAAVFTLNWTIDAKVVPVFTSGAITTMDQSTVLNKTTIGGSYTFKQFVTDSGSYDLLPPDSDGVTLNLQKFNFSPLAIGSAYGDFTENIKFWISNPAISSQSLKQTYNIVPKGKLDTLDINLSSSETHKFIDGGWTIEVSSLRSTVQSTKHGGSSGDISAFVTVVPEPYQYGLVSMFGLFGLAAFDRIRQRKLVG